MNDRDPLSGHDPFVVPPSQSTGCLPRVSKPGEWCPLASEYIPVIDRADWPDLIGKVRNSDLVWTTLNQGSVGSCAAEGCAGALMASRELSGQARVELNPYFLYYHTSGGVDQGSSIDENLRTAQEKGCASMDVWPRSHGWRTRPSADAYEDAKRYQILEWYDIRTVEEFASALFTGFVVEFGYRIGRGGHAVFATEMISTTRFRFKNSWGNWGDGGFGTLSLSDIYWGFGAWALRVPLFNGTI